MKHILLLFTGGTIASVKTEEGLEPVLSAEQILSYLPDMGNAIKLSSVQVCIMDSTNMSSDYWLKLVKEDSTVTAYFSADKSTWTTIGSRTDCGFLSDNFKLAIASQGTTSGSITYSDVTVNDK